MKRSVVLSLVAVWAVCAPPSAGGSGGTAGQDAGPPAPYVIAVDDALVAAAQEFAAYRAGHGFAPDVVVASQLGAAPSAVLDSIRTVLRDARATAPADRAVFLLLLGHAPEAGEDPAGHLPAVACVNELGDCWTDNAYGDLDDDGLPDVAVGRVPAHDELQALEYLAKVRAYESAFTPGTFRRRVSVYTAPGGFGPEVDGLIEFAFMQGLRTLSHAFDVVGAYNNPASRYYYQPFDDKVAELFSEGAIAMVYVGHGSSDWTEGLTTEQLRSIVDQPLLPLALFFACDNGHYTGSTDSIAESLLWEPGVAVASFASSEVSHPYGNAVLAYETMLALMDIRPPTVGETLQGAKRGMVEGWDDFREFLDGASAAYVPAAEQALIRSQHVDLYNLFGDPALRTRYPGGPVYIDWVYTQDLTDGAVIVTGRTPGIADGHVLVTLEVERDVVLGELEEVDPQNPATAAVQANWNKAINKAVAQTGVPVRDGAFRAPLSWSGALPETRYYVKAYAWNATTDAFGYNAVR
ncbi:MAG: hypothetical protein HY904_08750 [Deltaproteobacteria bacterium]|nr:hypothetical protein [Deltaproteobacteria bacterium]